jgi:hypothetical protein
MVGLPASCAGSQVSNTAKEWGWQYVFPARNLSVDPRFGIDEHPVKIEDDTSQKPLIRQMRHMLDTPLSASFFRVQSLSMAQNKPDRSPPDPDPSAAWIPVFRSLGLPSYQVRIEDKMACIEAPPEDRPRLLDPTIRSALVAHGKSLGYQFTTLDLG